MATQTLATADAVLQDDYRGPIIEQVNFKTYMLDKIERDQDSVDFTGRRAIVPVHYLANPSRGNISDGGTLPTPDRERYMDAIINIKYHAAGMEISDQAVKQARGDGAFVNLFHEDAKRLAKNLRKDINRAVFGDGTGLLANVASDTGPATTVTVDSTQYLKVGDPIDILVIADGTTVSLGRTVVSINRTTKVVTLDAAVTVTNPEHGLYLAGSYGLAMDGLLNITGTGRTLHGINSATAGNEFWNGKEVEAATAGSTAVAGEDLFTQLIDTIGAESDGDIEWIITTRGIRRRLAATYQSQKRFNDAKATEIHGGYTAIWVNEVPVIADDDAPKGYAFAGRDDAFRWFQVEDPDWLKSEEGQIWQLAAGSVAGSRRAAWQAWFVWYAALGSVAPNKTGRVVRATDDSA